MKEIKKISDIAPEDVADYIRLDEVTTDDQAFLDNALYIAKTFIKNYTGRTEEELDNYPDFVIVAFVLCQDMYDNRALYVDRTNLNKVVDTILGMHSVNLL